MLLFHMVSTGMSQLWWASLEVSKQLCLYAWYLDMDREKQWAQLDPSHSIYSKALST